MTVGWIREGDLDAFYEGTERTPDPGAPKLQSYSCPFCTSVFTLRYEFHDHVYAKHRVDRPFILMRGKEPTAYSVVRSRLDVSEITLENASHALIGIDGSRLRDVTIEAFKILLSSMSQGELKVEIFTKVIDQISPVVTRYSLAFRVAEYSDLRRVEQAFADILASGAITRASIRNFLADNRTQGSGKDYATGLAEYCLGVLVKERPKGERLTTPFSRYRDHYGRALDALKDFQRPLSRLISNIIRFSLNDFGNHEADAGFWVLDLATELLSDPASARSRLLISTEK